MSIPRKKTMSPVKVTKKKIKDVTNRLYYEAKKGKSIDKEIVKKTVSKKLIRLKKSEKRE